MCAVNVRVVYPADPAGVAAGGIHTFIRGIIHRAPSDLRFQVVGATCDPVVRPVGRWTECSLRGRGFGFFPVIPLRGRGMAAGLPLSLRFTAGLLRRRPSTPAQVLDFHRVEPALAFHRDGRPRNLFLHNSPDALASPSSDILWRYMPWLYRRLEAFLIQDFHHIYAVHRGTAALYRRRYPALAPRVRHLPTWVDMDVFYPCPPGRRAPLKAELARRYGFSPGSRLLMYCGRLERQKEPLRLVDAVAGVMQAHGDVEIIIVGEGSLREAVKDVVATLGLGARIHLAGVLDSREVSRILRVADLFVMASGDEGLPMSVLEALGSGVPVACTDVGEVRRVVHPGRNGQLAPPGDSGALAEAILACLAHLPELRGMPCTEAVADYAPEKVLAPVYEDYRHLAEDAAAHVG